jgi:integrase/recombinase XerD
MSGKRAKAPTGCYWRGDTLWGFVKVRGRRIRWSLQTDNPKLAKERREAGKARAVADWHGDAKRSFAEVIAEWAPWIKNQCGAKTVQRYACSLDQWAPYLADKMLPEVTVRFIAKVVRVRRKQGVTNATIKRDLVAVSSVCNFAIAQGWLDSNPTLPAMKANKEKRHAIVLPQREHVDLVIARCPGMIADMVRVAIATGAREEELYRADRNQIDNQRRQMTLIGKGRNGTKKTRVIDLQPFGGYELTCALPAYARKPFLFWHGDGEDYKNFASQFAAIVARTEQWATENGKDFRPFRFHDLRHLHAVNWLKDGRSIYDLQKRLGHSSIKVTELYLRFLTSEEELIVKGLAPVAAPAAVQPALTLVGDKV